VPSIFPIRGGLQPTQLTHSQFDILHPFRSTLLIELGHKVLCSRQRFIRLLEKRQARTAGIQSIQGLILQLIRLTVESSEALLLMIQATLAQLGVYPDFREGIVGVQGSQLLGTIRIGIGIIDWIGSLL